MTDGHKHRLVHIGHDFGWWPVRLPRFPLLRFSKKSHDRVNASPYPYGATAEAYTLSALGIAHRWTGLTLCTWARPCPVHDPLPGCSDETCTEDHA